jgi:nucleoside-diphosphate-sugar epimerase
MHYVITGGAGFIGSNLAEYLSNKHDVTIIDNISTGRRENLQSFFGNDRIRFIEGSITDLELLRDIFGGSDGIFHQAAIPSVPRSVEDPISTNEANVTGTLNVLVAARDCGVRKVVCASSSSVYGDTPELPKREDMEPNPLSPYAVSKLTNEYYGRVFSDLYDIQTVFLRYFNVYGPRQDPQSEYAAVIPKFITRLLAGQQPIIYGDGEQTRDFTFIQDVIQANVRAMKRDTRGTFNIAFGSRISLNDLTRTLMDIIGVDVDPIYDDPRPGDIKDSLADITAARTELGYAPEYDIRQGLEETVAWFRRH